MMDLLLHLTMGNTLALIYVRHLMLVEILITPSFRTKEEDCQIKKIDIRTVFANNL